MRIKRDKNIIYDNKWIETIKVNNIGHLSVDNDSI